MVQGNFSRTGVAEKRHRPAGGLGTQTVDQPHPLPRGLCAEKQTPRAGVFEKFERLLRSNLDAIPLRWF